MTSTETFTHDDVIRLVAELQPLHAAIDQVKTPAARTRREQTYWDRLYQIKPEMLRRTVSLNVSNITIREA